MEKTRSPIILRASYYITDGDWNIFLVRFDGVEDGGRGVGKV